MPSSKPVKASGAVSRLRCVAGPGGVIGRRFVAVISMSNDGIATVINLDEAGNPITGIAASDAAEGQSLFVYTQPGVILPITAGENVIPGVIVMTDNQSRAVTFLLGMGETPFADKFPLGRIVKGASTDAEAWMLLW